MSRVDQLKKFCADQFPFWSKAFQPHDLLVSEVPWIPLSQDCVQQIQQFVSCVYALRNQPSYQKEILGSKNLLPHQHFSVLMSFDFHVTDAGPKLIEINTNAAFSLLSFVLETELKGKTNFLEKLRDSFQSEFKLFSSGQELSSVWIVDEQPKTQKAYFEFEMFHELFKEWGWESDIYDVTAMPGEPPNLIYNRHTDFNFDLETSAQLKLWYQNSETCISPHPTEYALLADKSVLFKLTQKDFVSRFLNSEQTDALITCVPKTFAVSSQSREELWENRKQYFFKPISSHGGKAVYRGDTVRKNLFEEILSGSFLAQEIVTPPVYKDYKWDLRCYVYAGQVHLMSARLYKGTLTNFKTPGGGFAPLKIV